MTIFQLLVQYEPSAKVFNEDFFYNDRSCLFLISKQALTGQLQTNNYVVQLHKYQELQLFFMVLEPP